MENNTELNLDIILEVCALFRQNQYAKEPFTLANVYDIFNAFC